MFVERDTTGVESFTTADRATECTDAAAIDANTGTLGNILNNGTGGGVDGIQAVAGFDQYAGTELTGRSTDTGHDWRWQ